MKKCIISAIAGALGMLLILYGIAAFRTAGESEKYEHIDYVSDLPQENCWICGNDGNCPYWGESNVGLLNLNTFELMHMEINRCDEPGDLMGEPADYLQTNRLIGDDTYAHAYIFQNNGYAWVQITGAEYIIDRDSVQSRLCQNCLDSINSLCITDQPPAEYAVISFENRTIQPLLNACPWFCVGSFVIHCDFKEDGAIDVLICDCPNRYDSSVRRE